MMMYNEQDESGESRFAMSSPGRFGPGLVSHGKAGRSRPVTSSLTMSSQVLSSRGCHVSGGRSNSASASPSANFTDNRIHPYSLLQSRHSRGYRLLNSYFGGGSRWYPELKSAGCWKSVLSHIVNLWTRLGTHLPKHFPVSKKVLSTIALTLTSRRRNTWNAPAVAPHGSLTLSTTFLLPVTAVSITASVSLPDVLSPALKLPVYARAGGFPMVIDRLRVDRRLYNTNRIYQLEFNPVDAPCFGVIVLIHRCVKALFSESKGGGVYWIYSSGNGTTRNPKMKAGETRFPLVSHRPIRKTAPSFVRECPLLKTNSRLKGLSSCQQEQIGNWWTLPHGRGGASEKKEKW